MILLKVNWAPSETLFEFFGIGVRFYSLMFVIAFSYGYYLMKKMFEKEQVKLEYLEPMLVYMVFSTLLEPAWDMYFSMIGVIIKIIF